MIKSKKIENNKKNSEKLKENVQNIVEKKIDFENYFLKLVQQPKKIKIEIN